MKMSLLEREAVKMLRRRAEEAKTDGKASVIEFEIYPRGPKL